MKKLHEVGTITVITIVLLGVAYFIMMKAKPGIVPEDNLAEEILENIIEDKIGWEIDLTPNSPEEQKRLDEDARILAEYTDELKV